jgi:hypothetical protein
MTVKTAAKTATKPAAPKSTATRGRNWTAREREWFFVMIRAGATRKVVNETLASYQKLHGLEPREVPMSSFQMVRDRYIPSAKDEADLHDMIKNPRGWSAL